MGSDIHLDAADIHGEDQSGNPHAEHLADDPHRGGGPRGDPVKLSLNRGHDRVRVGGREKGEAETEEQEAGDNIGQACFLSQENQQEKADGIEGHADRGNDPGLHAVGKTSGKRREDGLRCGLKDENGAGMQRRVALYVLEEEAQKEADREGGAVVDQRSQIGEGEDPVSPEEVNIEDRALLPQFP